MILKVSWERDAKDEVCSGQGPAMDLTPESFKSPRSGCLARGHGISKTKVRAYEHLFQENTTLLKGQIYVWQLSCNCLYTASLRIQLERRQENKKI